MTTEQIQWLLIAASNAPIQSTADAKHKANVMLKLVEQLEAERATQIGDVIAAGDTAVADL